MPLQSYGVLAGRAAAKRREGSQDDTPHYQVHVEDGIGTSYRHCQLGGLVRRYEHGLIGWAGSQQNPCQAAVPVTSVQVVNRSVISRWYSWADSR